MSKRQMNMRTALVLRDGPRWKRLLFEEIKCGDVFMLVQNGKVLNRPPSVANSDAEPRPAPDHGVVQATELLGLTKGMVVKIFGAARSAGVTPGDISRGLMAMSRQSSDELGQSTTHQPSHLELCADPGPGASVPWWPYAMALVMVLAIMALAVLVSGGRNIDDAVATGQPKRSAHLEGGK